MHLIPLSRKNNSLWYKDHLYLCKNSQLKQKVLLELHTSPLKGHLGFFKTYHRVKKEFFWDGLKSDIHKFVEECLVFQQNKVETIKTLVLLQPLAIPSQCWETNLCTITPFQRQYSRYFIHGDSSKITWNPNDYCKDRDAIFTGNFCTKLFSCLGTQLDHNSYYHPQCDGKTKIVNKFLEGYIHCFVSDKQAH